MVGEKERRRRRLGLLRWGRQVAGLKRVLGVPGRGNSQGKDPEVRMCPEDTRNRQEASAVRTKRGNQTGDGTWSCRA